VAAAGSVAEDAELILEHMPVKVRCRSCGDESEAVPNRLVCGHCGDYHTDLISGDEMLLARLELDKLTH
jgi:hydrogenase nickel incorporation protein HypA/HybF